MSPHVKGSGESHAEQSQQAGGSFATSRADEDVCQHVTVFHFTRFEADRN